MTGEELEMAKNRACRIVADLAHRLESGKITEEQWFEENCRIFTEAYLARSDPRSQSGHSGDAKHFANSRAMLLPAIDRDGSFIDIGCANGHLIELLQRWALALGFELEMYGLDISAPLVELARRRLPNWRDRFYVGNALSWRPERRFDIVLLVELACVPRFLERELVANMMDNVVAPGGRLIVGPTTVEHTDHSIRERLESWGYEIDGYVERSHHRYRELCRRLYWIDKA